MANIETSSKKGKESLKGILKKSIYIDLTPMVDLGFLLITFFVFTSTMSRKTVMKLDMPYDVEKVNDPVCQSCALTVLLGRDNTIHYYEGAVETARFEAADFYSIREIIQQKKKQVQRIRGYADALVLIIKSDDFSTFKNFVDITDEVTINCIRRYYIDELTAGEKKRMEQLYLL